MLKVEHYIFANMPKGRIFAPAAATDGLWFQHRPAPLDLWPPQRKEQTSTGLMLNDPYKTESNKYPPLPPKPYTNKDSRNFKNQNSFSAHDNRNSFQDHGVYFGNGKESRHQGRRLITVNDRQHYTAKEYLRHNGATQVDYDYNSVYSGTYEGKPTEQPPVHRRFPRIHKEGESGLAKLESSTTDWYQSPDIPYKTPTHVLAVSQEPFLGPNKFKYSYHGIPRCYPSYDRPDKKTMYPLWLVQEGSAKSRTVEA